ncbi:hypothetical protein GQR58_012484 [Nymphon striatum]|nr:hypothetical protein GQR58_012484 [Nymphon striatum]
MCRLENVSPADIIGYVLEGNASRIYGRMMVGDASQWAVVKAALLGEYALPRGEAHRRFIGRRLEADEPVDIYVDSLERLGGRLGLASDCAFFRTHFYEGLPASVNKWAVMREDAYTARFETVVSRVRDYVRSGRAIERRSYSASVQAGLGAVRRVGLGAAVPPNVGGACFRCGGPHFVKACPHGKRPGKVSAGRVAPSAPKPSGKGAGQGACGDVIDHMGGVTVRRDPHLKYVVSWGNPRPTSCCGMSSDGHVQAALASGVAGKSVSRSQRAPAPLRIEDSDFVADFADGRWVVSWRWSRELPKTLQTRIGEYKCTQAPHVRERYNAEIQRWISKGWLKEWRGPIEGIIPLLAVFQPSKDKVRPVMDYRELNDFVECHTGDVIAVCGEKIREWRQLRGELKIVDLKSAYLQIHISENLWKYQVVKYKGVTYALTRLGFGLSCAPRIMTAILGKVLSMDERVRRGTDHYIDDIVVRESVLSAQELREHLARYGLESKAPEGLDGGRVLGISLRKGSGGHLEMSRGMALSEIVVDQSRLTKRGLFSLCGRLVGHYPVAGWLRPCCSFLKRLGCGGSWDEPVESSVGELANELLVRARAEDPVRGRWHVSPHGTVTVWTDASSLGMGVALEVDGSVAEDASWLRKESDHRHINVAELEAVARGINLAISWGFKTFTVATDSRTVISWMDNTVEGHRRVRTKGASEMLIKRRLGVIRDTITEFGLTVTVRFVSTTENKADRMTRVPKKWLGHRDTGEEGADVSAALATGESVEDAIWAAHLPHHLGVDRTLYLARQIRSNLAREQVKRELVGCEACQRIDPARREENLVAQGSLAVDGNWRRVAVDVTHYGAKHYLSMVDCGPSRFAIWRRLSSETAASIIAQLQGIVIERGPCDEFLLDNSTAFRSAAVEQFADEWGISLRFRAAYAPSGNGIVERNHRTIKRIAERGGISPEEATFWYNVTPRKNTDAGSVPSNGLYRYTWRVPFDVNLAKVESFEDSPFAVGDEVWVKPPIPSCTRQWSLGIVSDVVSRYVVRVDGMPRHVKDIRKRRYGSNRGVVHGDRVDTAGLVEPAVLSGGDASYADSTFWRTGAPYQSAPTPGLVGIEHPRWVGEVGGMAFLIAGDKRSGRQSGRGRRRKQTCVCVKPVSSEQANKEIFCQVASDLARVKKKEFGGERSGYRGGRRPRR